LDYLTIDFLKESILKLLAHLADLARKSMLKKTKVDSAEDYTVSAD